MAERSKVAVKAVEHEGDWFVVPSDVYEDFTEMTAFFDGQRYPSHEKIDEFEEKFGHMRTGGDLNNVQLYIEA